MAIKTAKVNYVLDGNIALSIDQSTSCGGCNSKSSCGISSLAKFFDKQSDSLILKNTISAKVGDLVYIKYNDADILRASFIVYLLPVLFLFLFATLGSVIQSSMSLESEAIVIFLSVSGLLLGGVLLKLYFYSCGSVELIKYNDISVMNIKPEV